MKKQLIFGIVGAFVIGASIYYYLHRTPLVGKNSSYRIALLMPVTHRALDEIKDAFQQEFSRHVTCCYDVYNAEGNHILLPALAEKIVHSTYDLVVTIATQPTLIMREIACARGYTVPIIATAVNDNPPPYESIFADQKKSCFLTGIIEDQERERFCAQLDYLKKLIPSVKKLLLIYTHTGVLDYHKDLLQSCCDENDIALTAVPIDAPHELVYKGSILIPGHDCVIILKDNGIVSHIESLVTVCERYRVPLYASDLNSLEAGATCAYGVSESSFGIQAAQKAYAILHDKKDRNDSMPTVVSGYQFKVNTKACCAFGIVCNNQE